MISKILIGYDGSPCADRALEFGLDLAERYSASIVVINVVELPSFGSVEDPLAVSAGSTEFLRDLRSAHAATLSKAKEKAAEMKPAVAVTTTLREGNPPDQIVATATEEGFDVVIVGHGREGRVRELFLGGVSERVAHLARCVVIIVK